MMHFLLDTNVFLWYFWGSKRIDGIKKFIESSESRIFISTVSYWEISIKIRTEKLNINLDDLRSHAEKYSFIELPVTGKYMDAYLNLPGLHKDPFDHMLLAQAITSPMRLITGDSFLADYSSLVMVI